MVSKGFNEITEWNLSMWLKRREAPCKPRNLRSNHHGNHHKAADSAQPRKRQMSPKTLFLSTGKSMGTRLG